MEGPILAMENSWKCPVRPYTRCTGQIWYVHWFPSWKLSFYPSSTAVQSGKYVNWNLDFINGGPSISYGEFFKVPCTTVHELYRSNLVCPLILILKAVFWSTQHSCTVLASMLTGIWIFQWRALYLLWRILQSALYIRTRAVQVKSGMSIDSHLESCLLVQTA